MDTKFIWKGANGAKIQRKVNGQTTLPFYTIAPVRRYKVEDDWKYASDFTDEQLDTLLNEVLPKAMSYREAAIKSNATGDEIPFPAAEGIHTGPVPLAKIHVVKVPANQAIPG